MTDIPVTTGELNRAALARQHLLARVATDPVDMVRSLVALQAQAVWAPYYGLWSRVEPFDPEDLASALVDGRVVRSVSLRGTVHLTTAIDAARLFAFTRPLSERSTSVSKKAVAPLDPEDEAAIAHRATTLLDARALSTAELAAALSPDWPRVSNEALWDIVRERVALAQTPPRAVWGRGGQPRWRPVALPPSGIGPDPTVDEEFVVRYLGAFGPATVADLQTWVGRTRLAPIVQRLADRTVTLRDADGARYLDLAEAPRPPADTPAPPRLIAPFDNLLFGYRDRRRFMSPEVQRRLLSAPNGQVPGAVLVDGSVAGEWVIRSSSRPSASVAASGSSPTEVTITLYDALPPTVVEQLDAEARRLRSPDRPADEPIPVILDGTH